MMVMYHKTSIIYIFILIMLSARVHHLHLLITTMVSLVLIVRDTLASYKPNTQRFCCQLVIILGWPLITLGIFFFIQTLSPTLKTFSCCSVRRAVWRLFHHSIVLCLHDNSVSNIRPLAVRSIFSWFVLPYRETDPDISVRRMFSGSYLSNFHSVSVE